MQVKLIFIDPHSQNILYCDYKNTIHNSNDEWFKIVINVKIPLY